MEWIFNHTQFPITMFPLNVTNQETAETHRTIDVVLELVDPDGFYQYVLEQFRK